MSAVHNLSVAQPVEVVIHPFEEGAAAILGELGRALAGLLAALPGSPAKAADVERALGLDRKLAWQVVRLARARQPLAEAAQVPARRSMERFLASARRKVPVPALRRVSGAFERFEGLVAGQGDRAAFLSMVGGLTPEANSEAELKVRKSLYRANAHVWGVRCEAVVRTVVFQGAGLESVMIGGNLGLHRVRRAAPLVFNSFLKVEDDPAGREAGGRDEALAARPTAGRDVGGMRVLTEFSTTPLPLLVPRDNGAGEIETEIVFPALGRAEAVTLYTSQHAGAGSSGEQSQYGLNVLALMPSEALICEVLVPAGLTDPGTARVAVYGRRGAVDRVVERRPADLLPQRETVSYLGAFETAPALPESARHPEAVGRVLEGLGWLGMKFDVYRCRVQFPVLHTLIRVAADTFRR